jgi:hypothetical protein
LENDALMTTTIKVAEAGDVVSVAFCSDGAISRA